MVKIQVQHALAPLRDEERKLRSDRALSNSAFLIRQHKSLHRRFQEICRTDGIRMP
jgi:hypothetical protein